MISAFLLLAAGAAHAGTTGSSPISIKGTQAPIAIMVQELKDAGRQVYTSSATAVAGVTTEALLSLSSSRGFANGAANATSQTVTAGKTLRITSWCCTWRNNTAAAGGVTCRLRATSNAATLVTSPVVSTLNATTTLATIGSGASACTSFPDGLELSGSNTYGVSQLAVGAVVGVDVTVNGMEY